MAAKSQPVPNDGYLRTWLVLGSFPETSEKIFTASAIKTGRTFPHTGAKESGAQWRRIVSTAPAVSLISLTPGWEHHTSCYAYAHAYIWSPEATHAMISLGSDDGALVWFNGRCIFALDTQRGVRLDNDRAPVELPKGWSRLLVKITQYSGDWAFALRILTLRNVPMSGLRMCLDDPLPKKWPKEAGARSPLTIDLIPPPAVAFSHDDPPVPVEGKIRLQNCSDTPVTGGSVVINDSSSTTVATVGFPSLKPLHSVMLPLHLSETVWGGAWSVPLRCSAVRGNKTLSGTGCASIDSAAAFLIAARNMPHALIDTDRYALTALRAEIASAPDIMYRKQALSRGLEELTGALLSGRVPAVHTALKTCVGAVEREAAELRDQGVYLVGHAHIDMNWLWRWPETIQVCRDTFTQALRFMDEYPEFRFSQSEASCYRAMEIHEPQLFERIKEAVKNGQWNIVGGMWTEGDTNLASGEALVRSFLLGQRYFKKHFSTTAIVGWLPDNFGHTAQLPQMLRGAGIDSFYHMRTGPANAQLYWWESPDGSRVLAKTGQGYNDEVSPVMVDIPGALFPDVRKQMFVYGVGDHGGGPTRRDIVTMKSYQGKKLFPPVRFATADEYFRDVRPLASKLPVHRGELGYIFDGCYTNVSTIKQGNRDLENALQSAEAAAFAATQSGAAWPKLELEKAWELLAFNQFHDILPGSAIHESNDDSRAKYAEGMSLAELVRTRSLAAIAGRIDIQDKNSVPMMVFNPLAWTRSDIVTGELIVTEPFSGISVKDIDGKDVAAQIIRTKDFSADSHVWVQFHAGNVPALGYRLYRVTFLPVKPDQSPQVTVRHWMNPYPELATGPSATPGEQAQWKVVRNGMKVRNRFFEVDVDRKTGTICSLKLVRKGKLGQTILGKQGANWLGMYMEKPRGMSAWTLDATAEGPVKLAVAAPVRFIQEGPESISWMTEFKHDRSQFWLTTTVHADSARIDCHLRADWLEKGTDTADAPMLRVHFSVTGRPDKLSCDVPFAVVDRKPGMEVPAQKWVDLAAGSGAGVAVLNRGKYGHSLVDGTIRLTLLRSAYDPDIHPDVGRHEISWAILPHDGTWKDAELPRIGMGYNVPFETFQARAQSGDLGPAHSFLSIDNSDKHFVVTGVKQAEDGVRTVIRGYDSSGKGAGVNITLPFKVTEACRTNLLEEPVDEGKVAMAGNEVSLKVKPWGIATVKVG